MDLDGLKSDHRDVYNQAVAVGAKSERERVRSWMAYSKIDPKAVQAGIESGEPISDSQRENLYG